VRRGGKSKKFMEAIRCLILQEADSCNADRQRGSRQARVLAEALRSNIPCWVISALPNNCIACTIS
jgi:hypothetical protein